MAFEHSLSRHHSYTYQHSKLGSPALAFQYICHSVQPPLRTTTLGTVELSDLAMLTASCHCGSIHIEVDSPPTYFNQCHCSICRRYGTLWAYYQPDKVRLLCASDATEIYCWGDKQLEFHRCRVCGCVTHWAPIDKSTTEMGINGRLFDEADVAQVPIQQSEGPA